MYFVCVICVYMFVYLICVCHVGQHQVSSLTVLRCIFFFWGRLSQSTWSSAILQDWLPSKPQRYFCPCFSGALVTHMRCTYAWLFHGCWGSRLRPQACVRSTLPTESFLQPPPNKKTTFWFYGKDIVGFGIAAESVIGHLQLYSRTVAINGILRQSEFPEFKSLIFLTTKQKMLPFDENMRFF